MINALELISISKNEKLFYIIIGFLLSSLTFTILYWTHYSNFFDRNNFISRKTLLQWFIDNENELNQIIIETVNDKNIIMLGNYDILLDKEKHRLELFDHKPHVIITNHRSGIQDVKNYNKIYKIVSELC